MVGVFDENAGKPLAFNRAGVSYTPAQKAVAGAGG